MIEQAKSLGLKVYAPENLTTYFYVTRDNRIGYAQYDRVMGADFSTVYKPNRYTGSGVGVESLEKTLIQSLIVEENYKSFEEFKNQHWQNLTEY